MSTGCHERTKGGEVWADLAWWGGWEVQKSFLGKRDLKNEQEPTELRGGRALQAEERIGTIREAREAGHGAKCRGGTSWCRAAPVVGGVPDGRPPGSSPTSASTPFVSPCELLTLRWDPLCALGSLWVSAPQQSTWEAAEVLCSAEIL